jgi:hypothetical protein
MYGIGHLQFPGLVSNFYIPTTMFALSAKLWNLYSTFRNYEVGPEDIVIFKKYVKNLHNFGITHSKYCLIHLNVVHSQNLKFFISDSSL